MPHDKKDNITHSTQANGKQCRCLRVFFVHFLERLCKARAEAKFTWIMPSRSQRCIYMNDNSVPTPRG